MVSATFTCLISVALCFSGLTQVLPVAGKSKEEVSAKSTESFHHESYKSEAASFPLARVSKQPSLLQNNDKPQKTHLFTVSKSRYEGSPKQTLVQGVLQDEHESVKMRDVLSEIVVKETRTENPHRADEVNVRRKRSKWPQDVLGEGDEALGVENTTKLATDSELDDPPLSPKEVTDDKDFGEDKRKPILTRSRLLAMRSTSDIQPMYADSNKYPKGLRRKRYSKFRDKNKTQKETQGKHLETSTDAPGKVNISTYAGTSESMIPEDTSLTAKEGSGNHGIIGDLDSDTMSTGNSDYDETLFAETLYDDTLPIGIKAEEKQNRGRTSSKLPSIAVTGYKRKDGGRKGSTRYDTKKKGGRNKGKKKGIAGSTRYGTKKKGGGKKERTGVIAGWNPMSNNEEVERDNEREGNGIVAANKPSPNKPSPSDETERGNGIVAANKPSPNKPSPSDETERDAGLAEQPADSDESSLVKYIVPGLVAFAVISILVILLMVRVQRYKAAQASVERKSKSRGAPPQGSKRTDVVDTEEAVALVDFAASRRHHPKTRDFDYGDEDNFRGDEPAIKFASMPPRYNDYPSEDLRDTCMHWLGSSRAAPQDDLAMDIYVSPLEYHDRSLREDLSEVYTQRKPQHSAHQQAMQCSEEPAQRRLRSDVGFDDSRSRHPVSRHYPLAIKESSLGPRERFLREDLSENRAQRKVQNERSTSPEIHLAAEDSQALHSCADDEMDPLKKIYIRISPRLPSDNYIEAASTSPSVSSLKSVSSHKLEWLTKDIVTDVKNETAYYHSEMSTQTSPNVEALDSKTVFGTPWQFGGTFTKNGGILQSDNSDVSLTLVSNAVTTRDYVDIYGAVFTEIQKIREKFDILANEMLVTPLVEYNAAGNYQFSRHVKIKLPHTLPEDSDVDSLRVYGFTVDEQGEICVTPIPRRKPDNTCWDQEFFWEFSSKEKYFEIRTLHFSGYFCTECESKSRLSSICARVFGSHVQINSKRREIRMILYIWDRRLNIQDFLQRIIEQECDLDRQLLADQQIPLPANATSDSFVIMKMDTLGEEEDRLCWRNVMRPNTNRPLFRPLQVRKLYQIIHCCQQSDPLRVEWALENVAGIVPSSLFRCCIDVSHAPESTTNFEQYLEDADDDYMTTFYVRDLQLSKDYRQAQGEREAPRMKVTEKDSDLIQALAEMSQQETESMCEAFGMAKKDIGNLCKKFSTEDKMKHGLVEECCRRVGQDNFSRHFPDIMNRLGLSHLLKVLEKGGQLSPNHPESQTALKEMNIAGGSTEYADGKADKYSLSQPTYDSSNPGRSKCLQTQFSDQSNEVFFGDDNPSKHYGSRQVNVQVDYPHQMNIEQNPLFARQNIQREPIVRSISNQSTQYNSSAPNRQQLSSANKYVIGQKTSSSGSDSALRGNSINSSDVQMSSIDFVSTDAQADSKEFQGLPKEQELDESEEDTLVKELMGAGLASDVQGFPEIDEELLVSRHGPDALSNHRNNNSMQPRFAGTRNNNCVSDSQNDRLNGNRSTRHHGHSNNNQSKDAEETFCKETFVTAV